MTVCFSCSCTCVNNETRTEDSVVQRSCDLPRDFSSRVLPWQKAGGQRGKHKNLVLKATLGVFTNSQGRL